MIQSFWRPAVRVDAVQFTNEFANTFEIFEWLHGCFVIEQGGQSEHRDLRELDGEGLPLPDAAPFLIIKTRFGEDRVNVGDWIVKKDEDHISVYSEIDFSFQFVKSIDSDASGE